MTPKHDGGQQQEQVEDLLAAEAETCVIRPCSLREGDQRCR